MSPILGEGSFGVVKQAKAKPSGIPCALKIVNKDIASSRNLVREVAIGMRMNHPHIARMLDVWENQKRLYMVFELCTGGPLTAKISPRRPVAEADALDIFGQLMWAVEYMHREDVAHRDLKLSNILLEEEVDGLSRAKIKVIDFGFSRRFTPRKPSMRTVVGSPLFIAPEVVRAGKVPEFYSEKCDIWSAGVILHALLCGVFPFSGRTSQETLNSVLHDRLDLPAGTWGRISEEAQDLVKAMLKRCPSERVSAEEAEVKLIQTPRRRVDGEE